MGPKGSTRARSVPKSRTGPWPEPIKPAHNQKLGHTHTHWAHGGAPGADEPESPKEKKKKKKKEDEPTEVAEAPWSVAEWAVALRFDNPRATVLVLLLG